MVLAHELAHVFAIQLSRSRVPRWFTEGLSELETARLRPEWTRHDDAALIRRLRRGELPTLLSLSNAFVTARGDEAARAYAHAAVAVEFLERRFGFPALRDALVAFGRGEPEAAVLGKLTGLSAEALEREFRAELGRRFARFDKQYLPPQPARAGSVRHRARGRRAPATGPPAGSARCAPAISARRPGRWSARARSRNRRPTSRRTRCSWPARSPSPVATRMPPWQRSKACSMSDRRRATATTCACASALAEIHRKRPAAAEAHLRRAVDFDPARVEPHALLAELYKSQQRTADRLAALTAAIRLDPQTDRVAKEVVLGEAKAGQSGARHRAGADRDLHRSGRIRICTPRSAAR